MESDDKVSRRGVSDRVVNFHNVADVFSEVRDGTQVTTSDSWGAGVHLGNNGVSGTCR